MEATVLKECVLGAFAIVGPILAYQTAKNKTLKELDKYSLDKLWERSNRLEEEHNEAKEKHQEERLQLLNRAHTAELKAKDLENKLSTCYKRVEHLRKESKEREI